MTLNLTNDYLLRIYLQVVAKLGFCIRIDQLKFFFITKNR